MPKAPKAAAAEGLSKLTAEPPDIMLRVVEFAGDFLNCCGDDRGPWGVSPPWPAMDAEKGVETGGVAAAPCWDWEGVLPW